MKFTKSMRKKLNRKLRANWTKENLLVSAFQRQIRKKLLKKLEEAKTWEEAEAVLNEFSVGSLKRSIDSLASSTFNKSGKEFEALVDGFINNPGNKYLNLRAKNMLKNKSDFTQFMSAYKHNVSLIRDLPKDLAKGLKNAYLNGTSFRGTKFAQDLYERLGKRARVIVRTESAKISSTLTQVRMQKLGLNAYIWSTSEDSRVRSAHTLFDGVLFFWDDPPTVDNYQNHCGRFINCRCVPIPITSVDDIQFPVKVAKSVNFQTKYVKGGKGKIDVKIVSGSITKFTKDEFLKTYGSKFL